MMVEPLTPDEQRTILPRLADHATATAPVSCTGLLLARLVATIEALSARVEAAEAESDTYRELGVGQRVIGILAQNEVLKAVIRKRAWNHGLTEAELALERSVCDAYPRAATADPTPQTDTDQ